MKNKQPKKQKKSELGSGWHSENMGRKKGGHWRSWGSVANRRIGKAEKESQRKPAAQERRTGRGRNLTSRQRATGN